MESPKAGRARMIRSIVPSEEIVDSFAGGGGAGLGIMRALGRSAGLAINHDRDALAMYAANHPETKTILEDVWRARLAEAVETPVGLLWASPDCKHFSRAKGGKPVDKNIRSLAWIVVRWVEQLRKTDRHPRVIILENVREFADWGPLLPGWRCQECKWRGTEGQAKLARTRRRCPRCNSLKLKAMTVECKKTGGVVPAMIPDPDRKGLTFKRWVGRLRNLGYQVQWRNLNAADYGVPTHRRRLFLVARRDGQPIVWPEPTHCDPKKVEATPLFAPQKPWRTAAECIDWDLPCPSIFDRKRPLAEKTQKRIAEAIRRYVLENPMPYIVRCAHGNDGRWGSGNHSLDEPLPTVTGSKDYALMSPTLMQLTHGGRLVDPGNPLPTITSAHRGEIALVTAFLVKHFGGVIGVPIDTPLPTTTMRATQNQIVTASLIHMNHGEKQWNSVEEPLRTITTGNHAALVYAFLIRYFGTAVGQHVTEPLYTITGKDRFGLVTVTIAGELWAIVDIGMRMLTPRELARAQGFDESYILTGTKTSQVARIGNSVPPPLAEAMVRANCMEMCI